MESPYYTITPYKGTSAMKPPKPYFKYFMYSLGCYLFAGSFLTLLYATTLTEELFATPEMTLFTTVVFVGLWIEILVRPFMAGVFFWLVFGLSPRAGSWAFNIVVFFILLTHVAGFFGIGSQMAEEGTTETMTAYIDPTSPSIQQWQTAYSAVNAPDILDFSRLNNKEEFSRQKKIINHYIQRSKEYQNSLREATSTHSKPISGPLIQAHLDYGNDLIQALNFLEQNQTKWTFTNNDVRFNDENALNKYRAIYQKIVADEAKITELSNQLHQP